MRIMRFAINSRGSDLIQGVKTFTVVLAVISALLLSSPAVSLADDAKYNFASAQGSGDLQVIPGSTTTGAIYFYNVDGNRTTYITLEVVADPDDSEMEVVESEPGKLYEVSWGDTTWEVEIEPALHDIQVQLNPDADPVTVPVNLYAEPTEVSDEEIEDVPEGMTCLTLPNKLDEDVPGYALAKPVYINISVPEGEEIGNTNSIRILATGSWLGQSGSAALSQQRDFDFNITTVYEITQEQIVSGGDSFDIDDSFDIGELIPWIIVGVVGIVVIGMGVVIIILLAKKKGA